MGDDGDEEANKLCCVLKFVRVDGFVSAILGEVFDLTSTNKSSVFRVVWPNLHPTIVYIDYSKKILTIIIFYFWCSVIIVSCITLSCPFYLN